MRIQTIRLTDLEADTLMGFLGELLDDNSPITDDTRAVIDSIYQKVDTLDEIEED